MNAFSITTGNLINVMIIAAGIGGVIYAVKTVRKVCRIAKGDLC